MEYKLASSTWDHKEIDAIQRVIESDRYTMGSEVSEYEKKYSDFAKICHCSLSAIIARDVRVLVNQQLQYAKYFTPAG